MPAPAAWGGRDDDRLDRRRPRRRAPAREWRTAEVEDTLIAVFNIDGEYHAVENLCTHDYAELTEARSAATSSLARFHGAEFNLRTGEVLTPPAYEPLPTFPVRVHDGTVQVRDPRWD